MFNAQAKLDRSRKTCLELLTEAAEGECVDGCEGNWLRLAEEVLTTNIIELTEFATAVYNLLDKGRGKYRNVMLTGPANCGKTFYWNPLTTYITPLKTQHLVLLHGLEFRMQSAYS